MEKTNRMATISQYSPDTGRYTHFERRVYRDGDGTEYVRVNGMFFETFRYSYGHFSIKIWVDG